MKVVHLSRNFGHAMAVCAGLDQADADAVILMDSDLQDDPAAFTAFLAKWREGYDVVYAIRSERQEGFLKRLAFRTFYRILSWIAEIELPRDAGNYSLMDRGVIGALHAFSERNLYFPGLRAWAGFRQTGVPVSRRSRHDSKPRVGLRGLWKLSMNAIFSFSYVLLFLFRAIGLLAMLLALLILLFMLYNKYFADKALSGWSSQIIITTFFAGINLLGIGVVGEYVARIYDEVKARPRYIVARVVVR